ncbi:hypothetical protein NEHOM01_1263 [Nematocida homosporus]|uniref:uncharacterized protein n=1 Tax=Nematocida homosporus TaxID=1912981 RepID=UPI002221289C|nr:uncharacterized protein NEHOM01_1263 [Nematocida homosporus]KAI5186081.1 hypothetical protein NEHOM01_1263 [Nematocida homosporus]
MGDVIQIKRRIKAYKLTIRLLKKKVNDLISKIAGSDEKGLESTEEGEIRTEKPKERRKRKHKDNLIGCSLSETSTSLARGESINGVCTAGNAVVGGLEEVGLDIDQMEEIAKKDMSGFLKVFFETLDSTDSLCQRRVLEKVGVLMSNTIKYVILHDTVLFAAALEKYEVFYQALYPYGLDRDGSEVSGALQYIYEYVSGEVDEEGMVQRCGKVLEKAAGLSVFDKDGKLGQLAFDAATAIRMYSKVLDWDWTYNVFIRTCLFPVLLKPELAFPVLTLSILYAEWHRVLAHHKSLEYVLQTLDKIAGVGLGENITESRYTLEAQLASALMLRQFRPGAAVKWHRQRIEEANEETKAIIEDIWKVVLL